MEFLIAMDCERDASGALCRIMTKHSTTQRGYR